MALRNLLWYEIVTLVMLVATMADDCPEHCECLGNIIDCSGEAISQVPLIPGWVKELSLNGMRMRTTPNLGHQYTLRKLSLANNNIKDVHLDWLKQFDVLQELNLAKNSIHTIDPSQWAHPRLKRLDLSANRISMVYTATFFNLPALTTLRISRNYISSDAFRNITTLCASLPSLKTLDLNRNSIENFNGHSHLKGLLFQHLSNITLRTLKLRRNKLRQLPAGIFYGLHSLTTLHLDNNANITEVNNGWLFGLTSLETLTLSHNKIGAVKEKSWDSTKELVVLDLSSNELGCRQTDFSLEGLQSLEHLLISRNCLGNLDPTVFGHLPMLKILDISHNQIQWSVEDSTGTFKTLVNLQYLDLSSNKIESIHNKAFEPLKALTRLDLSGNNIKTLTQNPFEHLLKLEQLHFNTSSLVCNCHLSWLPGWLKKESFNSVVAVCGFPFSLNGTSVFDLKISDFNCVDLPQPKIITSPENQTVLFGDSLTLECIAQTGDKAAVFIWKKGRVTEAPYKIRTTMSVQTNSSQSEPMYRLISQLSMPNVTHDTAGKYKCILRTSMGPSYSVPATIIVHQFPYFTKSPSSVVIKEGSAAELDCAASGFPVPQISWRRQDGEFFAAKERRLHYMPGDSSSFIKPVVSIDNGIYVCTAMNEAGSISITANITVIHAPNFSRPISDQHVVLGQSIVLHCEGTGRPRPTVTWYKDDELVQTSENCILLDHGQFLIFLESSEKDSGNYRCSLRNSLGVKTRNFTVTIQHVHSSLWPSGLILCLVVACVLVTSLFWVIVIYRTRVPLNREPEDPDSPMPLYGTISKSCSATDNNRTALLNGNATESHLKTGNHDSSSEQSTGKDSGVGDSAHRSNEAIKRQHIDLRHSKIMFLDSSSTSKRSVPVYGEVEEVIPDTSLFGSENVTHTLKYPTYASLRRLSASRLCPVSTPKMPNHGVSSLPRHAYRLYSSSLSHPKPRKIHKFKQTSSVPWEVTSPRCMEKNTWNDDDCYLDTSGRKTTNSDNANKLGQPVR